MNTGIMCTLGKERPANLTVVVMDNQIYENIGGPPTHTGANTNLAKMAEGAGCINCSTVNTLAEFDKEFRRMIEDKEMGYLVAKIKPFERYPWKWEQRKPTDGIEDKYNFLRYIEKLEGVVIHPGAAQN
jgi:thiamine pyrophosphate-dependent acetolactate synthase large subunit-like protein